MFHDNFNLLCSLKSSGLQSQGWSAEQAAHICEACSVIIEKESQQQQSK